MNTSLPGTSGVTHARAWVVEAIRLAWLRGTPFGAPVVPEVYSSSAVSSRAGRVAAGAWAPLRRSWENGTVPAGAGRESWCREARAFLSGSRSRARLPRGISSRRSTAMIVRGRTSSGSDCRVPAAAFHTIATSAWWSANIGASSPAGYSGLCSTTVAPHRRTA